MGSNDAGGGIGDGEEISYLACNSVSRYWWMSLWLLPAAVRECSRILFLYMQPWFYPQRGWKVLPRYVMWMITWTQCETLDSVFFKVWQLMSVRNTIVKVYFHSLPAHAIAYRNLRSSLSLCETCQDVLCTFTEIRTTSSTSWELTISWICFSLCICCPQVALPTFLISQKLSHMSSSLTEFNSRGPKRDEERGLLIPSELWDIHIHFMQGFHRQL